MKDLRWGLEKNAWLKKARGVSFEQLAGAGFVGIERHSSKPHQKLMIFEFRQYAWVVPYVEEKGCYFLKTAFPSSKYTRKYLRS